ncbi:hypothetical protein T492DRAFT_878422 [Pavlovales sp. CCMP2436]|nr:hypothetical protein T492DRAFT_878422 [Pavlovales sp. CCMP2436]
MRRGDGAVAEVAHFGGCPLAHTPTSDERAAGDAHTQRDDGAVAEMAWLEANGSSVGAAVPSSEEWGRMVASINEVRLVHCAVSTGVSTTAHDTATIDKARAAATEQGHQKRQRTVICDEPGCAYLCTRCEQLKGHKRSEHGAEQLSCEQPDCDFKTPWAKTLREHRKRHRIAGARIEPCLGTEQLGNMNVEEAAAPATQPAVEKDERMASLRANLVVAESVVEEAKLMAAAITAQLNAEAHGRELRAALNASAGLKAQLDAALDEQRKTALIMQKVTDSLRAELVAAKKAAEEAEQNKAAAVTELEAAAWVVAGAAALKAQLDEQRKAEFVLIIQRTAAHDLERMNSLRADLEAAKAVAEDRAAIVSVLEEVHGFELRAALDEAAVLTVRLDAALDEQRVAALSPLIVQDGAVAKLVAVRKSTDATAQAAVEVHGRELRAAVAEAEGRTAAAVAEAVEFMRQSAFAAVEVMAAEFKRELLAVAEAATLKAQLDHEQQTANEMRIKMKDEAYARI